MAKKPKKELPDGEDGAPASEAAPKKRLGRKKLVVAAAALALLAGAGGGGYVILHRKAAGLEATGAVRKPVAFVDEDAGSNRNHGDGRVIEKASNA